MINFYLKTRINDELLLKEIINECEDFNIRKVNSMDEL